MQPQKLILSANVRVFFQRPRPQSGCRENGDRQQSTRITYIRVHVNAPGEATSFDQQNVKHCFECSATATIKGHSSLRERCKGFDSIPIYSPFCRSDF